MAEPFPVGLPTDVQTGSYSGGEHIDSKLKFATDIGKQMTRNKYSVSLFQVKFSIQMNKAEMDEFIWWYHSILNKILPFNFPDPLTGDLVEYKFISPPSSSHIGTDQFLIGFSLMTLSRIADAEVMLVESVSGLQLIESGTGTVVNLIQS